jgi:hypothetical protein
LRVARTGLAILVVLGVITVLAPLASANPIATADYYVVVFPILLVPINYSINGLMLYGFYSQTLGRPDPHRSREARIHVSTFAAVVMLFTLLGALIDYLVWMGYVFGYHDLVVPEAIGGLLLIGATCYIVCSRYLGMIRREAILASVVIVLVNLLSWVYLTGVSFDLFASTCVPAVILGWVVLGWLLLWDAAKLNGHFATRPPRALPIASDCGQVNGLPYEPPEVPERERVSRKELLRANVVMMIVLLVISFAMISILLFGILD